MNILSYYLKIISIAGVNPLPPCPAAVSRVTSSSDGSTTDLIAFSLYTCSTPAKLRLN